MSSLLDRRLVIVTGKGGTGKTTVSAALGLAAERRGKRAILCEVGGGRGRARQFAPQLKSISIDPESAKREYLQRQVRSGTLAGIVARSQAFGLLTAASPGLAELLTVGKAWDLAKPQHGRRGGGGYELVILDAPATGYGLGLLQAPRTWARVARVGPIHRDALLIDRFLHDRALTAVLGVALAEEMPVNETVDLEARLGEAEIGLDRVVVNGLYPERFSGEDAKRIAALDGGLRPGVRAALSTALSEHRRARAQRSQLQRLRRGVGAPVFTLPFLFEAELGPHEVDRLSRELESAL